MRLLRLLLERASRRLVFTRRLPPSFGGRRLWVTPAAALVYYRPLSLTRWRDLFDFARECVRPGDCVWDVGANLGVFGFAAAHQAGGQGEILAIEAEPWLAELMRRSATGPAASAAPVHVLCAAISESSGIEDFGTVARARSGSHLLSVPGADPWLVGEVVSTHPVLTTSLDWLAERRRRPAVIKIDVEGAELAVLRGASRLLREHRPRLLLEVYEASADQVTALLHAAGYELYDFGRGWAAREPVTRARFHTLALPRKT